MPRLQVPEKLHRELTELVETSGLKVVITESPPFDLRVAAGIGQRECTEDVLEAGGWIGCATAWAMARKHGLAVREVGALLNTLKIKVRECCLGCFR